MRRYLLFMLTLGAFIALAAVGVAAAAGGEGPVTVWAQAPELSINVGFSQKAISKTRQTPVSLTAAGEFSEADGTEPPAIRELALEFDKAVEVHAEGIPVCRRGQLEGRLEEVETRGALKACGSALIGEGEVTAVVYLAEQNPFKLHSKVLLFKGGEQDGKSTFLLYAYLPAPYSTASVGSVTVTKHGNGRFGTLAVVKIPQIAGGAGSITDFDLHTFRDVKVAGQTYLPVSAVCRDGELKVHVLGRFEDGTQAEEEIIRACTEKS